MKRVEYSIIVQVCFLIYSKRQSIIILALKRVIKEMSTEAIVGVLEIQTAIVSNWLGTRGSISYSRKPIPESLFQKIKSLLFIINQQLKCP